MLSFLQNISFRMLASACIAAWALSVSAGSPAPSTHNPGLQLTAEERAWLKAHPTITVAINHGWDPIGFITERNELRGISVDYLRRVESLLGVEFLHVRSVEHLEEVIDRFTPYGQTTTSIIQSSPVPRRGLEL